MKAFSIASVLLLASALPSGAQSPGAAMSCSEYLKADRNTPGGVLGSVETDDAEADAALDEMGARIREVCSRNPRMNLNEAMMKTVEEIEE